MIEFDCDEKGQAVFNVSKGKKEAVQTDNQSRIVNGKNIIYAGTECNTTSLVNALHYAGWVFPSGLYPEYSQDEDKLTMFIYKSRKVDEYYRTHFPVLYKDWKAGLKTAYAPNEIHKLLEIGVNEMLGSAADTFVSDCPIDTIKRQVISSGLAVPISGCFGGLNHVVCLVGFTYQNADMARNWETIVPSGVIIDDPYGTTPAEQTEKYVRGTNGNDIMMSWRQFIRDVKPCGNSTVKFAHIIKPGLAVV